MLGQARVLAAVTLLSQARVLAAVVPPSQARVLAAAGSHSWVEAATVGLSTVKLRLGFSRGGTVLTDHGCKGF